MTRRPVLERDVSRVDVAARRDLEMAGSLELDPGALEVGAECNLVYPGPRGERGFPLCEWPGCGRESVGPFSYTCVAHFRSCGWCRGEISATARRDARFCRKACRQASHRFGKACATRRAAIARALEPLRLAYADPPYPGTAKRYYADHPDYGGEVDHGELLSRLQGYDGWALSTSARALPMVLGLCVAQGLEVRVGVWIRQVRRVRARWPLNGWEPVVFAGGRRVTLEAADAPVDVLVRGSRARTTDPLHVVGEKPAAFWPWLFDLLGAQPGDSFDDLFPGSHGGERAWQLLESRVAAARPVAAIAEATAA